MRFLSKKTMLVSLLALSLTACESTRTVPPPPPNIVIDLPCDGDAGSHAVATTIEFEIAPGSDCTLKDVYFIQDTHGNSKHFKRTTSATSGTSATSKTSATSGSATVVFTYDGLPLAGDAFFYYKTHSPKGDGGGGGVIH